MNLSDADTAYFQKPKKNDNNLLNKQTMLQLREIMQK